MSGHFIQVEADLLARNEWLEAHREAVAPYLQDGLDCTVFTFNRDEPTDRATTRVGGLPYWGTEDPWPVCQACSLVRPQPMQFIAQLDFRESSLHVTVPGDVLTFHYCISCHPSASDEGDAAETAAFRQRHGLAVPALPDGMAYVPGGGALTWKTIQPGTSLRSASELPDIEGLAEWEIEPFYGKPNRATDYPTPPEAFGGGIAGEAYTYLHFTLQGTKLGGYPPPIQDFAVPADTRGRRMRFLGTLGSLSSWSVDGEDFDWHRDFMWGDMGSLYLWISETTPSQEMAWFWECY